MNFLGVGVGELLLILVIAMLVVGPERMVELSGQMGRMLAKFREQSDSITREFKEAFTLELEDDEADTDSATAQAATAQAATTTSEAADGAAVALSAGAATATEAGEATAPAEPELSPEEVAVLEAVQLEQRLASDMVDGELEVVLAEEGAGGNGVAPEDEPYEEIEPIDVELAAIVPEDEDVEPTAVNDVLVIPDEDVSADLPLEAEE